MVVVMRTISSIHYFFLMTSLRGGILSLLLSRLRASSKLAILWCGDTPLKAAGEDNFYGSFGQLYRRGEQ